uniref:Ubiquitin-like protease family profile domain-containing protein n=1 Tax=Timema genevievae TaxID=629358 RepID=A0A7R9PMQ1_TIMGE|nr:unnamed protein product [Timema genevievae]
MDINDPIVLSFYESLLHRSDVNLLNGPHWLNDNVISFYFEYLEKVIHKGNNQILFVGPEVTQCLKISPSEELGTFLDPLKVKQRKFIFLALNDCEVLDTPGGTHWSLLVYSKPENMFFHFDSSAGCNKDQACKLSAKLLRYFTGSKELGFQEPETLQQVNGYDCGIHLICNAEWIGEHCEFQDEINKFGIIKKISVDTKRNEILELIESLKKDR